MYMAYVSKTVFGAPRRDLLSRAFDAPWSSLTIPCSVASVTVSYMQLITIVFFERKFGEPNVPNASYETCHYAFKLEH